jgi:hypothetical protein
MTVSGTRALRGIGIIKICRRRALRYHEAHENRKKSTRILETVGLTDFGSDCSLSGRSRAVGLYVLCNAGVAAWRVRSC